MGTCILPSGLRCKKDGYNERKQESIINGKRTANVRKKEA